MSELERALKIRDLLDATLNEAVGAGWRSAGGLKWMTLQALGYAHSTLCQYISNLRGGRLASTDGKQLVLPCT